MYKKILFVISFTLSLISCSDEKIYSCNEETNNWAIENLPKIMQMSRTDWIMLSEPQKQAAYNAFSPDQKIKFWKDKFEETKRMNWTAEERKHISKAEEFFLNHKHFFYKKLTDEELDELELFGYKWITEGSEKLGWTEKVGISIIATGNPLQDTNGNIIMKTPSPNVNVEDRPNCQCHAGNIFTVCNSAHETCEDGDCETGNFCGFLLLEECNGVCVY